MFKKKRGTRPEELESSVGPSTDWADVEAEDPPGGREPEEHLDGEVEEVEPAPQAADRVSQTLVIVALLAVIAVLAVGFLVVREVAGERPPETMAEAKIELLRQQIAEDPADPNLRLRLVEVYYGIQAYDEAKQELDDLYSQEVTGSVLALTLYADARVEAARGDSDAAVELYLRSLDQLEYPDARYSLAKLYASVEQWDDAIEQFNIYLETTPYDSGVLADLGWAYEQKGDSDKALETYREALKYVPDDPEILANVARLEGR